MWGAKFAKLVAVRSLVLIRRMLISFSAGILAGCAAVPVQNVSIGGPADPYAVETPVSPPSPTLLIDPGTQAVRSATGSSGDMKPEMGPMAQMQGKTGMSGMKRPMHHVAPTQPTAAASLSAPRWSPATMPTTAPAIAPGLGDDSHEHDNKRGMP